MGQTTSDPLCFYYTKEKPRLLPRPWRSIITAEIRLQENQLPLHASSPRIILANPHKPLASLDNVVLVDKPLISLIRLPRPFKLVLGRFRYIVEYMLVQLVMDVDVQLIYKSVAQKPAIAFAIVISLKNEMLMVAVIMLAALFLAQSSSPSSHSIAPFAEYLKV